MNAALYNRLIELRNFRRWNGVFGHGFRQPFVNVGKIDHVFDMEAIGIHSVGDRKNPIAGYMRLAMHERIVF